MCTSKEREKWLRWCSPLPIENKLSQWLPYTKVFLYLARVYTLFCSRNCISQLTHAMIVRFSDLAGIISLQCKLKEYKNLFWSTVSSNFISYGVSYFLPLRCSFMINVNYPKTRQIYLCSNSCFSSSTYSETLLQVFFSA